jgi:hypothetical protein
VLPNGRPAMRAYHRRPCGPPMARLGDGEVGEREDDRVVAVHGWPLVSPRTERHGGESFLIVV